MKTVFKKETWKRCGIIAAFSFRLVSITDSSITTGNLADALIER